MDRPPTPLKVWLELQGLVDRGGAVDYEKVARLCRRLGRKISPGYLLNIGEGYNEPSYGLCKFLSARLTGGAVSVVELKEYPYSRSTTRGAA